MIANLNLMDIMLMGEAADRKIKVEELNNHEYRIFAARYLKKMNIPFSSYDIDDLVAIKKNWENTQGGNSINY